MNNRVILTQTEHQPPAIDLLRRDGQMEISRDKMNSLKVARCDRAIPCRRVEDTGSWGKSKAR